MDIQSAQVLRLQSRTSRIKRILLQVLVIIAAGLAVFFPALHGSWLWDDDFLVASNPNLRSLAGLWNIWVAAPGADYWPLTSSLLWVEWHFWGNNPLGYHLCTLIFHLLNGFLLWRLFVKLGLHWGWLGALLFIVHPLAVESVAWISEIKNTFSLFFLLLSIDAYLDWDRDAKNSDYARSISCFVLALFCKTSVIMLPAILLLYCWWRRDRITSRDLRHTVPYFTAALVLGLVTLYFQTHQVDFDVVKPRGPFAKVVCAGLAVFFYLEKIVCPVALLPIYPRWRLDPPTFFQVLALPLLAALFYGLWTWRKGWGRHLLFGFGFFLLNLLPVLGLIHMSYMKISAVADHFAYLPMIGPMALIAAGLEAAHRRLSKFVRPYFIGALTLSILFLATASHLYAKVFMNQETLWSYTLQRNRDCKEAHNNLGIGLLQAGRAPEAMREFAAALRINPNYAQAHNNLGFALEQEGKIPQAIEQYEMALHINSGDRLARNNLARVKGTDENLPSPK